MLSILARAKGLLVAVVATAVVGFSFAGAGAVDCPTNDIMPCGADTPSEFISKLKQDGPGDMQTIYSNSRYKLSSGDYDRFAKFARAGKVNPSGDITVDGRLAATNAYSLGRNPKTNSTPVTIGGETYHESKIGDVTRYENKVMVLFNERGEVQTVVMNLCGNPFRVTPNNPKYECKMLNKEQVDSDTFKFSTDASASNGATINKVVYDFGDGKTATKTNPVEEVTYTYANAGTYTAKVTVYVNVPGNQIYAIQPAGECIKTITVEADKEPAITIEKKVENVEHKTVGVNTEYVYQITVENTGDIDLVDVVLTDKPESGVTLVSASNGSIANNEWTLTLPTLKVGEKRNFTITAKVPTYKTGSIKNTVCVKTPTIPGDEDGCNDATVDVTEPNKVLVCNPETGEIISVAKADEGKYKPANSPECEDIKVCILATKALDTIKKSEFDETKHTTDLSKCKAGEVLPSTGPTDIIMGITGMGSLAGAGYYWRSSRKQLIDKMLGL